jgi:uncharacterized membrane protein YdjX (TVP38/TMEM64 family)
MRNSLKRAAIGAAGRLPLLLVVLAAILFLLFGGSRYVTVATLSENARWLRRTAEGWGLAAPLLFIIANAGILTLLVVPSWFCTMVSGLLFGLWFGTAYALLGTTLGALAVFLAARAGLSGLAERAGRHTATIANGFRSNAFNYLVFLRLVPVFPFTLVNVAAALAGIPLPTYVLGTLIGIIPSVFIYASLGDLLMDLAERGTLPDTSLLHQPQFLLPLLGLAALALLPILVARWRRRR